MPICINVRIVIFYRGSKYRDFVMSDTGNWVIFPGKIAPGFRPRIKYIVLKRFIVPIGRVSFEKTWPASATPYVSRNGCARVKYRTNTKEAARAY